MSLAPAELAPLVAGKLGRLPVEAVDLGDFTYYATEELAAPPTTIPAPQLVYPMADNDRLGCCTISGAEHSDQAASALVGASWTYPGDAPTEQTYFSLTGGADTGLVESRVLQAWTNPGLFGKKLAAFAPLAVKHTRAIKQATALCGVVYTGILVPAVAQQQFGEHKPWALTHTPADSDIVGGHCVPIVGYSTLGPIVVTWGALQQMTWEWWLTYSEEAYAIITAEVKAAGKLRGVNLAALESDIAALKTA